MKDQIKELLNIPYDIELEYYHKGFREWVVLDDDVLETSRPLLNISPAHRKDDPLLHSKLTTISLGARASGLQSITEEQRKIELELGGAE